MRFFSLYCLISCLLSLSSTQAFHRNFTFAEFKPKQQVIDGMSFPRDDLLKYRGLSEEQMDVQKAVRAMLGDAKAAITSLNVAGLQFMLMGKINPFYHDKWRVNYKAKFDARGLNQRVKDKLALNKGRAYSELDALLVAVEILEEEAKERGSKYIEDTFINYLSGRYEDWPIDVIFSTVYLNVANIYSNRIVVYKHSDPTAPNAGIDLNYWNKLTNGKWVYTNRSWVDKGEFIHPFIVPAQDILGYQIRKSQFESYKVYRNLPADLDFGFYRVRGMFQDYVLIFDGKDASGHFQESILPSGDIFFYANSLFDEENENPPLPQPLKIRPHLIGVISLCNEDTVCEAPEELFQKHAKSVSKRRLPSVMENKITGIKLEGMRAKIFYRPSPIEKNKLTN